MNKGTTVVVIGALVLIGGLLYMAFESPTIPPSDGGKTTLRDGKPQSDEKPKADKKTKKATTKVKPEKRLKTRKVIEEDEFAHLSAKDKELATAVQEAMDGDDNKKIIEAAVKALKSATAEVRQNAIEALGWVGAEALAELTACLADPDDDVRDTAINNWECALAEVEDPKLRMSTALGVMGIIEKEDAIDSISGQFGNAAQEYIDDVDDEDKQNERRVEVVKQLLDVIESKHELNAEKGREAYNDLTGYEWKGVEEAEKYLSNPDEYEPPDED